MMKANAQRHLRNFTTSVVNRIIGIVVHCGQTMGDNGNTSGN